MLREIDAGRLDAETLVVVVAEPLLEDGSRETTWQLATPDMLTAVGLLNRAAQWISEQQD